MAQGIVLTRSLSSIANLNNATGTLSISNGGTGLTTLGPPNSLLGVDNAGTAGEFKTLVAGSGITINYTPGQIIFTATATAGVTQIVAGTGITISPPGGTGIVTVNATGSSTLQLYAENPVAPVTPVASGTNSIALLSASHAIAQDSLAIGVQSLSRIQGGVVQASGRFASSGDAQTGRYLLRTNTINNIPTTMFVDGTAGSVTVTMPDNSTWTFRITITGHRTDVNDGHAGYEFKGVIYRDSGAATTAIQGKTSKIVLAESNTPWDANVFADTTNGGFTVTVTGQTSKTIRWLALVETIEITN